MSWNPATSKISYMFDGLEWSADDIAVSAEDYE